MSPTQVVWHPSPNWGPRRDGQRPELVVIHYTAMQGADAALARLCDSAAEVSAHYLIAGDGQVFRMVDEAARAWHAGAGEWAGRADVNSRSIGIELDNRGDHPFAEPQMAALERLLRGIMARWGIPPEGVIGHSDMAPGRKVDPGPRFDWARLSRQGLARRAGKGAAPRQVSTQAFHAAARHLGYSARVADETLLAAVRLRYRPFADGPLSADDFVPIQGGSLRA